ncbi:MAG: hypothetical protein IBJ00_04940 [Alphaproteobacteria bacterium]|nr:hypothetical protein [Alphaproteobacteria bacterium]
MIKMQLNLKWVTILGGITLGGCNNYNLPPKEALKCGIEYPCNGCEGGCPYTSSYKAFFATSKTN